MKEIDMKNHSVKVVCESTTQSQLKQIQKLRKILIYKKLRLENQSKIEEIHTLVSRIQ